MKKLFIGICALVVLAAAAAFVLPARPGAPAPECFRVEIPAAQSFSVNWNEPGRPTICGLEFALNLRSTDRVYVRAGQWVVINPLYNVRWTGAQTAKVDQVCSLGVCVIEQAWVWAK